MNRPDFGDGVLVERPLEGKSPNPNKRAKTKDFWRHEKSLENPKKNKEKQGRKSKRNDGSKSRFTGQAHFLISCDPLALERRHG